jgi:hypothetical protein
MSTISSSLARWKILANLSVSLAGVNFLAIVMKIYYIKMCMIEVSVSH